MRAAWKLPMPFLERRNALLAVRLFRQNLRSQLRAAAITFPGENNYEREDGGREGDFS